MKKFLLATTILMLSAGVAHARDTISIVGSSTVFPFVTAASEGFARNTEHRGPVVESTGSGGGLKIFCQGVGIEHPDITNASRAIKDSEIELCASNGVTDITEILVGYDGIVVINGKDGTRLNVTVEQLFLALAKNVEDKDGNLVENYYIKWSDVDSSLPDIPIRVYGPPPTSGTRDSFVEIVMEEGAESVLTGEYSKEEMKSISHTLRTDGAFIEAGENDNLIIGRLEKDNSAYGIVGFSFLDQNMDAVEAATINGVEATFENIASGEYVVSRSLYMYVKDAHLTVVPGMKEFVDYFLSDSVSGEYGYLTDKGLIPVLSQTNRVKSVD